MNRIVINGVSFEAIDTLGGSLTASHAMVGESLAADTVEFTVIDRTEPLQDSTGEQLETVDAELLYCMRLGNLVYNLRPGEEVFYYVNNSLYAKFYLDSVEQIAKQSWKFKCTSVVGKLIASEHLGGMYDQTQSSVILADILAGLPYTVDEAIASATVKGYLPIGSRRDNLKRLLLVTGGSFSIDNTGKIRIGAMSPAPVGTFNRNNVFSDGRVKDGESVKGLQLVEHNYIQNNEETVLYEDFLNGSETIRFNEPCHSLSIEGGTITESGANYAKVTANGYITLIGKRYTHITRDINVGDVAAIGTNKVISVTDETLANPQIAQQLAERLFAYKQHQKTIVQDVVLTSQRAGDVVNVINPFTMGMSVATIKSLNIKMSGKNRASAEFVLDYVPNGALSGYKNVAVITQSGTWQVPANTTKILAILCGAGSGGYAGGNGENGEDGAGNTAGKGGKGGVAGEGGAGGKILEVSMSVTPSASMACVIGAGGAGGASDGASGTVGGDTTFGGFSSANGRDFPYGYRDSKSGLTIGYTGNSGTNGGRGGDANSNLRWATETPGDSGEDVGEWHGGSGSVNWKYMHANWIVYYSAAGGGGAAVGNNGGRASTRMTDISQNVYAGVGADSSIPGDDAASYGCGGNGGNGGGGGGGGAIGSRGESDRAWSGGAGGLGSAGGRGYDGCIIIYY